MKKNDVKAGIVYGYEKGTSEYRNATPMIVLDAKGLWTWHRHTRSATQEYKVSNEKRYTAAYGGWSSYSGPHGYLVLVGVNHGAGPERDAHLAELETLYEEFSQTAGNPEAVNALAAKVKDMPFVHMEIVNNRWISGDYVEAKNAEDERRKAREAQYKAERDRSAAERALMDELAEILAAKLERPVHVTSDRGYYDARASVKLSDLAEYFGIKSVTDRL
jgi:hypothetical protein